jgi:RHS repeat-associated protein
MATCLKKKDQSLWDWETAERVLNVVIASTGNLIPSAVVDSGECAGAAIGDAGCAIAGWVWPGDVCNVDTTGHCDYERSAHAISLVCENDCFNCNARGENCGAGSCNVGRNCFDDCREEFFGIESIPAEGVMACPNYAGGGGCPAKAANDCAFKCTNACNQNCVAQATPICQSSCARACAPVEGGGRVACDDVCDSTDLLLSQCRSGCVDKCVADNSRPSGTLRYGGRRELNHNLTKVKDGAGLEVVVNTYGEDPSHPSFDSVIAQTNGDFALQFRYRDLGAEQRGLRPVPTDPLDLEGVSPVLTVPTICPDLCIPSGETAVCVRAVAGLFPEFSAERATKVVDAYGVPRTFYFGALGEILGRQDIADRSFVWTFNYQGGQLSALRGPDGAHQCIQRDAAGNVVQLLQFPTPGSVSDNSTAITLASPRVFKWTYKAFPSRLESVSDPTRASGALQTFDWNDNGNLISVTDGNGAGTTFVPTSFGPPDTATLPNGTVTKFVYDQTAGVLKSVIRDSEGATPVTVTMTSDGLGRPSVATGTLGETTTWQWDGGKISSLTRHATGFTDEVTSFSVDNNGRVYNTNNGQLSVTTKYDRLGHAQSVTAVATDQSAPTRVACFHRGPDGRLLDEVLPRGNRIHYEYDGAGRLRAVTKGFLPADPGTWDDDCPSPTTGEVFQVWSGVFAPDGTIDSFVDAEGATTTVLAQSGFGEPAAIREPNGRITHRGYNPLGKIAWEATYACGFDQPCASPPQYGKPAFGAANLGSMTELVYDLNGALSSTDVWHFDPLTRQAIGDGHARTSYTPSPVNDELIVTDDGGRMTRYRTDRLGRPSEIVLPTNDVIKTEYADGGATIYRSWPGPIEGTGPIGPKAGVLAERTRLTPWGAPSDRAMLEGQDPIAQRPARQVQSWTYDSHRRHTGGTDVGGSSVTVVYDAFNQARSTTRDFGGGIQENVTQTFTGNGLLDTRDSQAGSNTPDAHLSVGYDLLDRVTSVTRNAAADTEFVSYGYLLGSSSVEHFTDARGVQTDFVRWAGGALRTATAQPPHVPGFPGFIPAPYTRTFTYDGVGRMATARVFAEGAPASDETVSFGWDSMDNKISEFNSRLGQPGLATDRFDGSGRRVFTSRGVVPSGGVSVDRINDPLGRLEELTANHPTNSKSARVRFGHVGLGNAGRSDGSGALASGRVTTEYKYDTFGRLAGITLDVPNPLAGPFDPQTFRVSEWQWKAPLDGLPRVATFRDRSGAAQSSVYQVDPAGRLTAEANALPGQPAVSLTPIASTSDANTAVNPTVGASPHRLLNLDGRGNWVTRTSTDGSTSTSTLRNALDQYTSFGNEGNSYEGGALSAIGGGFSSTEFKYDPFGQLISVGAPLGDKVTYTYDALGRMTSRTDGGATELFAYDGAERAVQWSASRGYAYMIDGQGIDEHLLRYANGRFEFVHQDRMGSVYSVTTDTGTVLEQYAYTAYGTRTIKNQEGATLAVSAIGNDLGFQGQRHDTRTDMIEMRHRWYRPDWGRFISSDPIGLAGGSNFYAFGYGSPLRFRDPLGLMAAQPDVAGNSTTTFWDRGSLPDYASAFGAQGPSFWGGGMAGRSDYGTFGTGADRVTTSLNPVDHVGTQAWWANQPPVVFPSAAKVAVNVVVNTGNFLLTANYRVGAPADYSGPLSAGRFSYTAEERDSGRFTEFMVGAMPLTWSGRVAEAGTLARGVAAEGAPLVLEGGTGRALAGHGYHVPIMGETTVPAGSTVTFPTGPGLGIPEEMGQLIEQGAWNQILENPRYVAIMEQGAVTHLPGARMPNVVLAPADAGMIVFGNSIRVPVNTAIGDLLVPYMGHLDWAACLKPPF